MDKEKMEYAVQFQGIDYTTLNSLPLMKEHKYIEREEVANFLTAFSLQGFSHHHVQEKNELALLGAEKYLDVHVFYFSGYAMQYDGAIIVPDHKNYEQTGLKVILTSNCFHEWKHTSGNHRGDNYYQCSKCQETQYVDSSD